ncbi:hypothetical protein FHL15_010724 [Xylaria flabelliformis]|uniref:Uncharacterized protein n=1 Tax=Xylaria flabelliformis TaxID=2512241 RepID=A0A553HKD5_9PEZI|nr:hypothetical protein FHL15_010724 [Xylaria flabelliformis]
MSSSRSQSEDIEDQHTDPYFDAEEDEDENEDPDYNDEEDEQDEDDMTHDLFEEEEDEFHDAEEGNLGFIVQVEGGDEGQGGEVSEEATAARSAIERRVINLIARSRAGLVSQREILNLLRGRNLGILLNNDDDDDDDGNWGATRLRRRRILDPNRFPKVPSEKGRELMNSGTFGAVDISSPMRKKKQLARRILERELGTGDRSYRRMNQGMIAQVSRTDQPKPDTSSVDLK